MITMNHRFIQGKIVSPFFHNCVIDCVGLQLRRRPVYLMWQELLAAESNGAIGSINELGQHCSHSPPGGITVNMERFRKVRMDQHWCRGQEELDPVESPLTLIVPPELNLVGRQPSEWSDDGREIRRHEPSIEISKAQELADLLPSRWSGNTMHRGQFLRIRTNPINAEYKSQIANRPHT